MANSYKILGQIYPTSNTLTNVYVTGASISSIVNSIYITNQDTANANVDIVIRPINESLENKHFLLKNQFLGAADTIIINPNITLNASAILAANITYRAGDTKTGNVSINAFGVEIT
jgi:hypothetical protein